MKPVHQDAFGVPRGNCFVACIASILELRLDDLRDIEMIYVNAAIRWDASSPSERRNKAWADAWHEINCRLVKRYGCALAVIEPGHGYMPSATQLPFLMGGPSPRGKWGHYVVADETGILHDPHPEGGGLAGDPEEYLILVAAVAEK